MRPVWDRLHEIEVPVLLLAGELDETYVEATRRMADSLPNAVQGIVPSCGHAPQLEDPDAVATVLREFLGARF